MNSGERAKLKSEKSSTTADAPGDAAQTSELWVRVESRSRPGRFYWTTTDGLRSQWTRPAARQIVPPTNVAGNLGKLPGDALNLILADYCDPAAAARAAAASRGGYTAAAAIPPAPTHHCPSRQCPHRMSPCHGPRLLLAQVPWLVLIDVFAPVTIDFLTGVSMATFPYSAELNGKIK